MVVTIVDTVSISLTVLWAKVSPYILRTEHYVSKSVSSPIFILKYLFRWVS
jgi:hypothetical protein